MRIGVFSFFFLFSFLSVPACAQWDSGKGINRNNHSLSVKTNAVGWGMLAMNMAIEYDVSRAVSVVLPVYYSPFDYFVANRKFRTFCIQPEVRYWFGGVDGLFAGAHIGMATYNYAKKGGTYRYQDSDAHSPLFNLGIGAGYRLPLDRYHRWCLELSLGVGYAYLHYDRFFNIANGAYVDTCPKDFFGIDHVGVSFCYRIDWKGDGK